MKTCDKGKLRKNTPMIKVNLLRDQTAGVHKTFASPAMSPMGLIYGAILLLATGAMGTWSFYIHRQVTAAVEKRTNLRTREARLHGVQKEIEKYQKMSHLLQSRIDVIEELKESQTGPVLLLNTVIQSIPPNANLWLTSLTQNSNNIKISGFAQQTEVIPDLMNNLLGSGIFDAVDLEEIESREGASKFSLLCRSIMKRPEE
jgi:Tfp pilus assembly protein PilN